MATKSETTETRWPVLITVIGLGGIYLALPDSLSVGPPWLLLVLIAASAVPAIVAHYTGYHRLDTLLGDVISVLVTLALVGSLVLLIRSLASKSEPPAIRLPSAAALWVTNILVFALWYWRPDARVPHDPAK